MKHIFYKEEDRGYYEQPGLSGRFSFSFAEFGDPGRCGFGLLKVLNEFILSPGSGLGFHAQQNMEVVCIITAGQLHYKNTIGYEESIGKNGVLITSSGNGLGYEERNISDQDTAIIQFWIEPKLDNIPPRHQYKLFPSSEFESGLTTIVSNEEGDKHCWINQNCKMCLGVYQAGEHLQYNFDPCNKCIHIFVISGELHVEDHHLKAKDAVGLWGEKKVSVFMVQDSCFILTEVPINH